MIQNFELYLISSIIFIITPGQDTLFVLNRSLGQSKKPGLYASLGIVVGIVIHTLIVALGLGLLIAKTSWAYDLLKYGGGSYLIYLGVKGLISKDNPIQLAGLNAHKKNFTHFWQGLLTNLLNVKVILFFLSYFPQFVDPHSDQTHLGFIFLGMVYALLGFIWLAAITYGVTSLNFYFTKYPKVPLLIQKISGFIFILLGLRIMF